jgi:hypothetical protein
MNNFELAVALVLEPKNAIREIEARPRFLFPLLVTALVTAAATFWYYSIVDMDWFIDQTIRSNPRASGATEEQLAASAQFMTAGVVTWSSVVVIFLFTACARLLESVWYLLAGKVTNVQRTFKQWFSLASWTSLPQLIAVLPAIPLLLTAKSTQMDPSAISPLTLNELFFHRGIGDPGYSLFTTLNLIHIFTIYLAILGVKLWSGRSWLFASVYVLLPIVVIVGVWALVAL